ncbi:anti-sigma factor domain-containing protein [Marinibactrum halimedae]|uniref:Anti-sigma K factor RskA C-terminal domain-containing protein n=1 Tax=Marinibactrum halimedae TaxID=1444977 RepID=A0AA37T2Z9_9GAMM|nr:anti-sigma factor [Marinibactrum halimedae]MCD9460656.1 anti-sigma factor [Marinibactrum halimedae]GLS24301.1 hypothetical protein GCM10007877_00120 [Marinibactrum halimedae]
MSGRQDRDESLDSLAFEYVAGTLRGEERADFAQQLKASDVLQESVLFWETQLMGLQTHNMRMPAPSVWGNIVGKVNASREGGVAAEKQGFLARFWQWAPTSFAAAILVVGLFLFYPTLESQRPNTDYIAVLTDDTGRALLTALTAEENKDMWLKWELEALDEDRSVQLWAISKRDGETRPIAVLDSVSIDKVPLDEATWRLVTDAEYLVLTEEELGGSAIDEPSDRLLAKGICVRFSPDERRI